MPYLASPGLSMISVPRENTPPGLYRQEMTSGIPAASFRKSICVMSSRLMVAPNFFASTNSSAGVSLEENMISLPPKPQRSDIISSVSEEQSVPQPSSFKIFKIVGLGVAFTAKYSLNPLFQENALFKFRAVSRIPFSSYK